MSNLDKVSRQLAHLLRHDASNQGLNIQADGYVAVDEILQTQEKFQGVTIEEIEQIVKGNEK